MRGSKAARLSFRVLIATAVAFLSIPAQPQVSLSFSRITNIAPLPNGIEVRDGDLIMQITALRPDVIRLRAGRAGALPEDASWAVLPESRASSSTVTQDNNDAVAGFHTQSLRVTLDRRTGLLTLSDAAGTVLQQQTQPVEFESQGFHLASTMRLDEHFFGLGDKTGAFDRRQEAFRLWNTDAYAWQESTDPIYKSIPFYLSYRAGTCLGILIDNTWPSSFDFGKTLTDTVQYRAEGGSPDIYFLAGPSAKHVLESYAWLTGPTPLPPLWALGFQQSRYSYMSQSRVLEVAKRFRQDKIPADAIYLDIDYQQQNRPFTVNTTTFPDLPGMISTLHAEQFHVVAITDLHIANLPGQSYAPFDSGIAGDHFVHNADGSIFSGPVWPGPSVFPEFTRQHTREWWGTLYTSFVHMGLDGFWNDMNEPSVFNAIGTMPDTVVHRIDEPGFQPRTAFHREIHNVYGMENSRATFEGQLTLRPDLRPFVLTRASYAGGQRYAATWTGDDSATWNHLRLTTSMLKNLGLSGFSLAGADVGGYAGTPTADLLTKWIEIAAFQPIDRDHAEKGTGDHEPWASGPGQEDIRRHFIEERYKLLPYLYTVMEDNTRTGLPLLRPLFLEFPDATADRHPIDVDLDASGEFMVGPDLLVAAPPFLDKVDDYEARLPGGGWYDYWTGAPVSATAKAIGGIQPEATTQATAVAATTHIHPEPGALPVFVRAGAIIPIAPLTQSTEEKPQGPLTLRVFPGPQCAGQIYQDDGISFNYRNGNFLRVSFSCEVSPTGDLNVHIGQHEGRFPAWWSDLQVEVNGISANPVRVTINSIAVASTMRGHTLVIRGRDDGKGVDIVTHTAPDPTPR